MRPSKLPSLSLALLTVGLLLTGCGEEPNPRTLQGRAGQLVVDDAGKGDELPVIFVHGNAGSRAQWSAQLEHLRLTRRAIAFDLRGMGDSELASDGTYTVEAMADDLHAVVEELDLERFILVGHSLGGAIVATYAGRHPNRVAGVLFVDPAGDFRQFLPPVKSMLEQAVEPEAFQAFTTEWFGQILGPDSAPGTRELVMADLRETPREVLLGVVTSLSMFDPAPAFAPYSGPQRSIVIEATANLPVALHNVVPGLPHETMSGVGHWLMMDKPEDFNVRMDAFLSSVPR